MIAFNLSMVFISLINEHSRIDSDQILHNTDEIDIAIHTRAIENKYELSKSKIDKIIGVLSSVV